MLWRFQNLKEYGVVHNRQQLKRLQEIYGFPLGRMLSPQCRVWLQEEVLAWVASRPVEYSLPLKGVIKKLHERKRERERQDAAAAENGTEQS